jgi:hypothetical protein
MPSSTESEAETAAAFASKTTTPITTATLVRRKVSSGGGAAPTSSVHELLECPVCTNSMYPPIHQEEDVSSYGMKEEALSSVQLRKLFLSDTRSHVAMPSDASHSL